MRRPARTGAWAASCGEGSDTRPGNEPCGTQHANDIGRQASMGGMVHGLLQHIETLVLALWGLWWAQGNQLPLTGLQVARADMTTAHGAFPESDGRLSRSQAAACAAVRDLHRRGDSRGPLRRPRILAGLLLCGTTPAPAAKALLASLSVDLRLPGHTGAAALALVLQLSVLSSGRQLGSCWMGAGPRPRGVACCACCPLPSSASLVQRSIHGMQQGASVLCALRARLATGPGPEVPEPGAASTCTGAQASRARGRATLPPPPSSTNGHCRAEIAPLNTGRMGRAPAAGAGPSMPAWLPRARGRPPRHQAIRGPGAGWGPCGPLSGHFLHASRS
jgi:hypothetical protein